MYAKPKKKLPPKVCQNKEEFKEEKSEGQRRLLAETTGKGDGSEHGTGQMATVDLSRKGSPKGRKNGGIVGWRGNSRGLPPPGRSKQDARMMGGARDEGKEGGRSKSPKVAECNNTGHH